MAASNYTIITADDIESFKFGDTAWTESDFLSTANALDTTFATNNGTPLMDAVGSLDANSPVESAAWVKDISFSGNERNITEEDLLGKDTSGAQNKEIVGGSVSRITCELTMVYRNNVPLSLFRENTRCALMTIDNEESASTGKMNFAMNNILVESVGQLKQGASGAMEQRFKFTFKGGTVGAPISVTQTAPSETWSKVAGGDYAEEVRLT